MVTTKQAINAFLAQKKLALAGVSRGGKKFGNTVFKELSAKGYTIIMVHPEANEIDGQATCESIAALPDDVDGLIAVVPPAQTENLVREAAAAGINRIWMQQGASSPEAVRLCEENSISVVHDECILMFAEPTAFIHRAHRWIWGLLGKLPK